MQTPGTKLRVPMATSLALCLATLLVGCTKARTANRIVVPSGDTGWYRICYGRPGAPSLSTQNESRLVEFRGDHAIETSSAFESGWASDQYFYQGATGDPVQLSNSPKGPEVAVREDYVSVHDGNNAQPCFTFVIGSMEDLAKTPNPWGDAP